MKHVMYAEKSLLMDDDSAQALIDYAGAIAATGGGDTVNMIAVGDDGNQVDVVFLLNSGTELVVESASSAMEAPGNADVVAELRRKTDVLRNPPAAHPAEPLDEEDVLLEFDEMTSPGGVLSDPEQRG